MFNRHAGLAALCLFAAVSAHAHVPFLKPSQFNVENPRLHVESAFTEYPFQASNTQFGHSHGKVLSCCLG